MNVPFLTRVERFLARPWDEKRRLLAGKLNRSLAVVPKLRRIDPGFLYVAWNDAIRTEILDGTFEPGERRFVQRFLRPGMTMVDVGAYYGIYSLIASLMVGRRGRVIAFEPSPTQRRRLRLHLKVNRLQNVRVESVALGSSVGEQTLYAVSGGSAGFSSLRRPDFGDRVSPIPVPVTTLDAYLLQNCIEAVDLIKIDVEGGELDVFRGAQNLLRQNLRPVMLCELQDMRTEMWGHKAEDASAFVEGFGFRWFRVLGDGSLTPVSGKAFHEERNLVAVPPERASEVQEMIEHGFDGPN